MLRSYCAMAMSRATSADARLALLRPASKIVCASEGPTEYTKEPPLNRPESSVLAVPAPAVSEMRGKKAARAAPMFAFADSSCSSAWSTSGRCTSTSEGTPAGTSGKVTLCVSTPVV